MNLSNKTALVVDSGLYVSSAQRLGESFGKVYYWIPEIGPYPESSRAQIGLGFPEMRRIREDREVAKAIEQADLIVFFDCYMAWLQQMFRSMGKTVFGAGACETMETDKVRFYDALEARNLPLAETVLCHGLEDLEEHLRGVRGERWLKSPHFRGDFETHKFVSWKRFQPWLNDLRCRIGRHAETVQVLVQSPIEADAEVGYDGYCIDGKFPDHCMSGYEIKDKGYIGKVLAETPEILAGVNQSMSPLLRNYRGHYSTEIRVTKNGEPYFIDLTARAPSPPGELMAYMDEDYPETVWRVAHGEMPDPRYKHLYGAEVILTSDWLGKGRELCVEFPKEFERNVRLKKATKSKGGLYIVPSAHEDGFFGGVVATGPSVKAACEACMEVLDSIECDELDYDPSVFDQAHEQIEAGAKYGVRL